jgi:putative ABC transport system permease protein
MADERSPGNRLYEAWELARDGWSAIWIHKLRSVLTLTGIVFGAASLVAMFSIVASIQTMVVEDFDKFGTKTTFEFEARPPETRKAAERASKGLRASERDSLVALELSRRGSAGISGQMVGRARLEPRRYTVMGVDPDYLELRHMTIRRGRSLADLDVAARAPVAVLGTRAVEELFGDADPIGRELLLGRERFRAVGVVEAPRFRLIPEEFDWLERQIYIPVSTYLARFTGDRQVEFVVVSAPSYEMVGPALRDAESRLLAMHHGVRDFEIDNNAADYGEDLAMASSITTGWNIVLGAIAFISLVIGGIGLFSILQVSVRERVREIGVRKSVGAEDGDIRREFLTESLILAACGGLAGIALGAGLCKGAAMIAGAFGREWFIPISPLGASIGIVFSLAIGFLFGIYPARRAAELDPVDAISA